MKIFVCVPMEEGNVWNVRAFESEELAKKFEKEWLTEYSLEDEKDRERAADWGTGIAIWECEVEP